MPLQYYLTENKMTADPDDYMAVSLNPQSFTIEDVYEHMTREGSTVTRAEALAGFEEVLQGIVSLVQEGYSVATPLVNISASVSGVFEGDDDTFDADRHQVRINVSAGTRLRETAEEIPTEKVEARERLPRLAHYSDNSTETQDTECTPGGGARITGTLLKFDESDPNQGVFFVNTGDGSETPVDTRMMKNKPSELIFINPALPAGTYRLEVRSQLSGTTNVRTGNLPDPLTVT